jgi:hypothetical protein
MGYETLPVTVTNVYFLATHAPREVPGTARAVNGLIVHAAALLHPDLRQPDAGLVYRCLTEFPGRTPGCLVPLSTLDHELDGGRLWRKVADWPRIVHELEYLARAGSFAALRLALSPAQAAALNASPAADGPVGRRRARLLASIATRLPETAGGPPLQPGGGLLPPPAHPSVLPYQPAVVGADRTRRPRAPARPVTAWDTTTVTEGQSR